MGANERLSLEIQGKAIGTAEIEKLAGALNKVVDISAKIGQPRESGPPKTGFEDFPRQIKTLIQDPLSLAETSVAKFAGSFGSVGLIATGAISGLAAFAAASESAARQLADLGVSVRDTALKTGLSTREVGQFGFAARAVGQDVGVFETGMRKLSQALGDSGPEGDKARKALSDLGVKTRELNGELKPTSAIFEQIAAGLARMQSPFERNAEVIKIFGRGGIELIPVLDGLNQRVARAKELGFGLSQEEVDRYDRLKEKLTEIDTVWASLKRKLEEGIVGKISFVYGEVRNAIAKGIVEGGKQGFFDVPGMPALGEAQDTSLKPPMPSRYTISDINRDAAIRAGGFHPERYSLRSILGVDSMEAADSRIGRDQSAFGGTLAGAEYQASQGRTAAENARTAYFGLKNSGAGVDAIEDARKKWVEAEAAARQYEDRVKSIRTEQSKIEAGANGTYFKEFQSIARRLGETGEDPIARLREEYQAAVGDERMRYLPAGQRQTAQSALDLSLQRGLARELQKLLQEGTTGLLAGSEGHFSTANLPVFNQSASSLRSIFGADILRDQDAYDLRLLNPLRNANIPRQPTSQDRLRALPAETEFQVRMAQVAGGPGDEVAIQQKISDIRIASADKELQLHKYLASIQQEDEQALSDAEFQHEQQLLDVKRSNIEMLAQLRKDQLDKEVQTVTGFVSAAMGGTRSVQSYFKGLATNTGETVLSNFLKSNPKMLDSFFPHAQAGTTMGGLLKGTLFGPNANDASVGLVTAGSSLQTAAADLSAAAGAIAQSASAGGQGGFLSAPTNMAYNGTGLSMPNFSGLGIPGLGTFGSDVNGLTGVPGLTDSTFSDLGMPGGSGALQVNGTNVPGGATNTSEIEAASKAFGSGNNKMLGMLGKGAAAGAGIFQAVQGFSEGGARNAASGVGGLLSSAAAITSMIPGAQIATPFLAAGAGVADLVSMLFPDPKQLRQQWINKTIGNAKYEAPESMNVSLGVNGGYSDLNAFGSVRSSDLSPYPTGQVNPSQWYYRGQYNQVPGSSGTPYGAPIIQIQGDVLDPQDYFNRNSTVLANAMIPEFSTNTGLAMAATKATVVG